MSLKTHGPRPEAHSSLFPPSDEGPQRDVAIRHEMGDMVKQLHELRRRLEEIDGELARDAVEAVIRACFQLDEFLRSSGTAPGGGVETGLAIRPRATMQLTPRQAALAQLERAHKEKEASTDKE
ncbi:hypothetical protein [Caballeronia sp. AZ10_KS36]|uniref:hypothetical protein n=1 Tax=Caballeronia sp. AZ10_KS36 TaxID=2921757 RepID=UPI00202817F1|nr:hypothetical protein [Caballeronia sp. AZ10_KS36]